MFSKDIQSFTIDLDRPQSARWSEVIAASKDSAQALLKEAGQELRYVPWLLRQIFALLYRWHGGQYTGELAALAKGLGVSRGTVTILNCAYELSHLRLSRLLGCTAGVRFVEGKGMVHVRTLDWPLPSMGPATRLFRFRRGAREFVVVGVPGQVGALSGMKPGGYSVTINWAPPGPNPDFNWGPTFLLRHVLETCDTYAQAFAMLRDTVLSTSVFFTVCGVEPGEGCVIERTQGKAVVRDLTDGVVVQANHHVADRFKANNAAIAQMESAEFMLESGDRAVLLADTLGCHHACNDLVSVLDKPPVLNKDTVQKMVFCPRTGEVEVWKRIA